MNIRYVIPLMACLLLTSAGCGRRGPVDDSAVLVVASENDFNARVLKSDRPVLVDFWAPWCPPCRAMNPVVADIAARYHETVDVVKINVDDARDVAERFHIRAIPTFMLVQGGQVVKVHEGAMSKSAIEKWLKEVLEGNAKPATDAG